MAKKVPTRSVPTPSAAPAAKAVVAKKGVITRKDGRELVRLFLYFDKDVSKALKRHCFENEMDISKYVNQTMKVELAKK